MPNLSGYQKSVLCNNIENTFRIFNKTETAKMFHEPKNPTLGKLWSEKYCSTDYFRDYNSSEALILAAREVLYDYMTDNDLKDDCKDIEVLKNQLNDIDAAYETKLDQDELDYKKEKLELEKQKLAIKKEQLIQKENSIAALNNIANAINSVTRYVVNSHNLLDENTKENNKASG